MTQLVSDVIHQVSALQTVWLPVEVEEDPAVSVRTSVDLIVSVRTSEEAQAINHVAALTHQVTVLTKK